MELFVCLVPGFRFWIQLCNRPWDRAGRVPLGAGLEVFGKRIFYLDFFLPDSLLYHIEYTRKAQRGEGEG